MDVSLQELLNEWECMKEFSRKFLAEFHQKSINHWKEKNLEYSITGNNIKRISAKSLGIFFSETIEIYSGVIFWWMWWIPLTWWILWWGMWEEFLENFVDKILATPLTKFLQGWLDEFLEASSEILKLTFLRIIWKKRLKVSGEFKVFQLPVSGEFMEESLEESIRKLRVQTLE